MSNAMAKVSETAACPPSPVADGLSSAISQSVTSLQAVTLLVSSHSASPCMAAVRLWLFSC